MIKFLTFKDVSKKHQKTKRYDVYSAHDNSYLGYVYWRTGWRRYIMHFDAGCDWSIECMAECYKFTAQLMTERKKLTSILQKNRKKGKIGIFTVQTPQEMCPKCGHTMSHHINIDEGYRCHGINYDDTIKDSVQCECRLLRR